MIRLNKSYPKQIQSKNRSSKQLKWLTGAGTRSIMRCVSMEQLKKWSNQEVAGAYKEIERRQKKADKKA